MSTLQEYTPNKWHTQINRAIYPIGMMGPISLIPQVIKAWEVNAQGISVFTWALMSAISCCWIAYGMLHKTKALVAIHASWLIMSLAVIGGVIL